MERNVFEEYKRFMNEAVEVGRKVYPTDGVVTKIQNHLNRYGNSPSDLFSAMRGDLTEEIYRVEMNLEELKKPKKLTGKEKAKIFLRLQKPKKPDEKAELNKQVPDATRLAYLLPVMMETIASSQKYHMSRGDEGIVGAGEITFVTNRYPSIGIYLKELFEKGAEFDMGLIREIGRIENKETVEWLRNKWT